MAITDIYASKIRDLEFAPGNGTHPDALNISGDVWAVACSGPDRDAWLYTMTITSSGNNIGTISIINSLELEDGITCYSTKLRHIDGNYYAVAYIDDAGNTIRIVTVEIQTNGTITGIVDGPDTLITGVGQNLDFARRSSGVFLLAYSTGFDNLLITFDISDVGVIDTTPLGTQTMAAAASGAYFIYHLPTTGYFLIAYRAAGLRFSTYNVDAAGNIGAEIGNLVLSSGDLPKTEVVNVAATVYAAIYQGPGSDGWISTFSCTNVGVLGAAAIDDFEFDAVAAYSPTICEISSNNFGISWRDTDWDGQIASIYIDNAGYFGVALLSQVEYTAWSGQLRGPQIYLISAAATGLLAVFCQGSANDGWLLTFGIGDWSEATITTQAVTNAVGTTATGNGNLTTLGAPPPSQHGHCWNITGTPTISDNKTENGAIGATGAFTSALTGLTVGVTYYCRAYATNVLGTVYGAEVSFTAIATPTVTTNPATSVEATIATLNGTLDDDGGEACDCGFEWGETIAYGNTTLTESKATGEAFSQDIEDLSPNTTYHFRAFATNSQGTSYGSDQSFTTPVGLPILTTEVASAIGLNGATLNGALTSDGGEPCYCGFEWGATIAYGTTTLTQRKVTGEVFSQSILNLGEAVQYHFRAFATNSAGTAYGEDRTIDTLFRINKAYALARYEI